MLHYRGAHLIRPGLVGIVVIVCLIAIGLQAQKFLALGTTVRFQALFAEAAGLSVGDDVIVSGVQVGNVQKIELDDGDARVTFSVDSTVRLGTESSAHIKTSSLLGKRNITVESAGPGRMRTLDTIPDSRTSAPYSLTDAVGDLTTTTAAVDTDALNRSLDMLSQTLDRIAPQVGPAFDGLTQLSQTINSRNQSLRELLDSAKTITGVLSERSSQVNALILNANSLLEVLAQRRQEIVELLANTAAVSQQLSGLVADNEAKLGPTLDRLNSVTALLEKNRDNIGKAIPGYAKVALTQGEAVSGGRFYNAYVANLIDGQDIQPFIDRAFGVNPPAPFPIPHPEPPR
ncbi:MCE family protein [Nocardia vermiculata]|uniref:MCE family protein n=1 Tax=Nocardia vermiculata TaxID=257274 RepID=A0A846Y376_9NOCA|nr:MCE family protein [Nocardia vermiculata]NKY52151.1 MCE family protein [Nocardia vermiculata]